jgi:predicted enzyme related to lactoylglutathione lyase
MSTGKFCWFDLMTTDVASASAFYGELFGWELRPHGAGGYHMLHDRAGRSLGGMMASPPGQPSAWLPYATTDDIAATVATIREHGGRFYLQHKDENVGEFIIFSDAQGAAMAALQPSRPLDAYPREKGENHITWTELQTADPLGALTFYQAVFGWASEAWGPDYLLVGDEHAAAIRRSTEGPPSWLLYVNTDNADATTSRVEALGGRVLAPVTTLGEVGRFAVYADPTGATFAVMESARR